jgi:hypothetical protein
MAPPFNQLQRAVNPVSTIRRNGISGIPIIPKEYEGHNDLNIIVDISSVNFVYFLIKINHCYSS